MVEFSNGRPRLYLGNINPFSPEERKRIREFLRGKSDTDRYVTLGTAKILLPSGSHNLQYSDLYSKVERITGTRPRNSMQLLDLLFNDVVFFGVPPKNMVDNTNQDF